MFVKLNSFFYSTPVIAENCDRYLNRFKITETLEHLLNLDNKINSPTNLTIGPNGCFKKIIDFI